MPILLATNNQDKIIELQSLLKDLNLQIVTPSDLNLELDIVEDGLTYAENATKKALAFAQASGLVSLADDSGLEVDALNGEPGVYSARYGSTNGNKLTYAERRAYLIQNLQPFPRPWTARFKATIAIAIPKSLWSQPARLLTVQEQAPVLQSLFHQLWQREPLPFLFWMFRLGNDLFLNKTGNRSHQQFFLPAE